MSVEIRDRIGDVRILVVGGVAGSGKTTIGRGLAMELGWAFADADDFHPESNRKKMSAGIPLTEEDRLPWLAALHQELMRRRNENQATVLACSALRDEHRKILSEGLAELRFVFLQVAQEVIAERLAHRSGHFFPASLLSSQFATLEIPSDAIAVDANAPPETVVGRILERFG
jgi:gluconokinase